MELIDQSVQVIARTANPSFLVERAARTCYDSVRGMSCAECLQWADMPWDNDVRKFCPVCVERNANFLRKLRDARPNPHLSVFEHASLSMRIETSRGILQEIARHRICSLSVSSTRYIGYGSEGKPHPIKFIRGMAYRSPDDDGHRLVLTDALFAAERAYLEMRDADVPPQLARDVLPNALATQIIMTANAREWRHFLQMRWSKAAHPDMIELAGMIRKELMRWFPVAFEDLIFC